MLSDDRPRHTADQAAWIGTKKGKKGVHKRCQVYFLKKIDLTPFFSATGYAGDSCLAGPREPGGQRDSGRWIRGPLRIQPLRFCGIAVVSNHPEIAPANFDRPNGGAVLGNAMRQPQRRSRQYDQKKDGYRSEREPSLAVRI